MMTPRQLTTVYRDPILCANSIIEVTAMSNSFEIPHDKLTWHCDLSYLPFTCTAEMTPLEDFIGQERAIRAIEFGLGVDKPGFNIFVTGLTGTGKTSIIKAFLKKATSAKAPPEQDALMPEDWCYVYNFTDPDRPQALRIVEAGASYSRRTWSSSYKTFCVKQKKCSRARTMRISAKKWSSSCKSSNKR